VAEEVDPLSGEKHFKQKVKVHHSIHMSVKKSAFRHLSDNLPQLGSFHALLREIEHHSRVYNRSSVLRQTVLEFGGPHRALFLLSNTTDNLASFLRKGGEGLPKAIIWCLCKLLL
jgi:hypothetical protein